MDAYSLGQYLREAREANEIDIAGAVAKLRIRQPILEAFEAGEFEIAGVPEIQVRGMLRIYGRFLDLDEEHVLVLYDQMRFAMEKGRRARRRRGRKEEAEPTEVKSGTQPMQEMDLAAQRFAGCRAVVRGLLILILSAAALAIIVFVALELVGAGDGAESVPSLPATDLPATLTPLPQALQTEAPPPPTASNRARFTGSGILVSLLTTQRSWVRIMADGVEQYAGIAAPETTLEYSAVSEISLSASNAMALDLIWNGQQQGQIGGRGQGVDIQFTPDEVIVVLGPEGAPTLSSPAIATDAIADVADAAPAITETAGSSPAPSKTLSPSDTPIPTAPPTRAPSNTPIPSVTPTVTNTPEPTAILPPRVTQAGLPPTKPGA